MRNYRNQVFDKTCGSCIHLFIKCEYDEYHECYCVKDTLRPKCCSVKMNEFESNYYSITGKIWSYGAWEDWANIHNVNEHGVCDDWCKRGDDND